MKRFMVSVLAIDHINHVIHHSLIPVSAESEGEAHMVAYTIVVGNHPEKVDTYGDTILEIDTIINDVDDVEWED